MKKSAPINIKVIGAKNDSVGEPESFCPAKGGKRVTLLRYKLEASY